LTTIDKLLIVQDRDRRIRQLSRESEDIPARRKLSEERLKEHKEALQAAQELVKKNAAAIKGVELEIDTAKQRILKLREQQVSIKTNEQYRAMNNEVAGVEKQIREFEDREIVLMEETEGLRANVAHMDQRLKQEDVIVQSDRVQLEERLQAIQSEIERLKQERAGLVTDVDPEWLSRYDRTFKHHPDFALVPVDQAACGGCHMKLPPQVIQNVKRNQAMVCCSFCGRILYWRA
jgi:predicted  nucleic acid-binding Zn-ribbon protein